MAKDTPAIERPAEAPLSGLAALDRRSREVFRQIVDSYLATGEPVGSRNLSRVLPMTLSPASIRNVMSDLEHAGLIYAPHTSAGRLPTQSGLRMFVDGLLEVGDLTDEERRKIEAQIAEAVDHRRDQRHPVDVPRDGPADLRKRIEHARGQ